jgi:hypothetical protein
MVDAEARDFSWRAEPAPVRRIVESGRLCCQAACTASRGGPDPSELVVLARLRKLDMATKEQIIHRAYELWEQAGKPDGRDQEFYHQAEKELAQGTTSDEKSETFLE